MASSASTTPPNDSGSDSRIVTGCATLPNSSTSTPNTIIRPVPMAVMKPVATSSWISASPDGCRRTLGGQLLLVDDLEEGLARAAQRVARLEIDADHGAALAVVAVDRARAAPERDVGDGGERDGVAGGVRDAQVLQALHVGARVLLDLHADRDQPVAGVELGEVGVDVADGGDADRLGDLARARRRGVAAASNFGTTRSSGRSMAPRRRRRS